jgi:hypothetical protein
VLLTTERLGQITPADSFKFVCWEAQKFPPGTLYDFGAPVIGRDYVLYITPSTEEHLGLAEIVEVGMHPEPWQDDEDVDHVRYDAGRIRREKTGEIVLFDHSSSMELGDDPVRREIVGRHVQNNIATPDIKVLWQVRPRRQ